MFKINKNLIFRIERALTYLSKYEIHRNDCIIVGSAVVSLISDRIPGDIDIALKPDIYKRLANHEGITKLVIAESGTVDLHDDFQILRNRYADIRIDDDKLFNSDELIVFTHNLRFARPEVEMAKKIARNYDKDLSDVDLFLNWARGRKDWNWDYLNLSRPHSRKELVIKGLKRFVKSPYIAARKFQDVIVQKLGDGFKKQLSVFELPTQVLDLGVLIQLQMRNGTLQRYDILVRKLFADEFFSKKKLGKEFSKAQKIFQFYDEMQQRRIGRNSDIRFQRLLDSMLEHGHDLGRFPIQCNKYGHIYDGSHRTACAISLKNNFIPVKFNRFLSIEPKYGKEWFIENFSGQQIKLLEKTEKEILISTGAAFNIIIWPPAVHLINNIKAVIEENYKIITLSNNILINNFSDFIDNLYSKDGISKWKIERKKIFFAHFEPTICVISIVIDNPCYRRNFSTGAQLSDAMAILKGKLRNQFRDNIPGYFNDVICHSGDNPQMNREIIELIKKNEL